MEDTQIVQQTQSTPSDEVEKITEGVKKMDIEEKPQDDNDGWITVTNKAKEKKARQRKRREARKARSQGRGRWRGRGRGRGRGGYRNNRYSETRKVETSRSPRKYSKEQDKDPKKELVVKNRYAAFINE